MNCDRHSVSLWISILYRYRKSFLAKKLEQYGALSGLHFIVLVLQNNNGASQEQISNLLKIDKATVARSVRKLEREGYVVRETDQADKRAYKICLTPKAESLVPMIQSAIAEWDERIVSDMPDASRQMLQELLKHAAENACNIYPSKAKAGERREAKRERKNGKHNAK